MRKLMLVWFILSVLSAMLWAFAGISWWVEVPRGSGREFLIFLTHSLGIIFAGCSLMLRESKNG